MAEQRNIDGLSAFQLSQNDVEHLMMQGSDDPRLGELFGEAGLEELLEVARKSGTRRRRRDVRVLLLPGILGSTIGKPGSFFTGDTIWFDPISIAKGDATKIALRARQNITALGTIPALYAPLRMRLQWAGYEVDDHFYDWRTNLDQLGRELAKRISAFRRREPDRKICLVAHSMGGLVSRAALTAGADVHRLIMLGTPNRGSFAAVQVLRAINSTVRLVDKIDRFHTAAELTKNVFRTFPSVYQMLPQADVFDRLNLYDLATWPRQPVRPLNSHLAAAADVQAAFAKPGADDKRFFLIAGCDQDTVTDLELRADETEFNYISTRNGDGTVPLNFAELPGVPTRYVRASHSGMLNFASVARAVRDLIENGTTAELDARPTVRRAVSRKFSDTEIQDRELFDGRQGAAISPREQRLALESMLNTSLSGLVTPPSVVQPSVPLGPGPATGEVQEDALAAPSILQGVTIGRRRLHRMDLELVQGSLLNVPCRAYVIGVFENVAPAGPALALDKALNGALSEFFSRRLFSGEVGRISVMPTGRNLLRADLVVFAGLGQFDRFRENAGSVQHLVAKNIIRTLVRSGVEELATIVMGGGSGQPIAKSLQHLMQGFVEGLLSIDAMQRFRRVILCEMNAGRYEAIRERLLRLTATDLFRDMEVTLDERVYEAAAGDEISRISTPVALPQSHEQPTYVSVRIEGTADDPTGDNAEADPPSLVASVLAPGGKATVFAARHDLQMENLDKLLHRLDPDAPEPVTDLEAFGRELADVVLPDQLRQLLQDPEIQQSHFSVIHDSLASRIPWETIQLGDTAPALASGLSRRYLAQNLSIAKWVEQRLTDKTLDVLLIVNPTKDLAGTVTEASAIRKTLASISMVNTEVIEGTAATRDRVLAEMRSGNFDVIHYAGHAFFDPLEPSRSGIICSDGVLSGQDLVSLDRLPALIFFNACESARVRGERVSNLTKNPKDDTKVAGPSRIQRSVSLAEAFLRGGIAQYVGTYWPVGDDTAAAFSRTFYELVSVGRSVGESVLAARATVKQEFPNSIDWADYLHYGDANFRLKDRG